MKRSDRYRVVLAFVSVAATCLLVVAAGAPRAQEATPSGAGSILGGVFTAAQAGRGQQQFQRACASCHDISEQSGRRFTVKWAGATLGDVYDLMATTMPEANPGSLQPSAYASILAFMLKESGYPEGQEDLPSELDVLRTIRVEPLPR